MPGCSQKMNTVTFSTPFSVTVLNPDNECRPARALSLGLSGWAVPRAASVFRVNEAFPAAFSGSLNLMKLRPFQFSSSVRPRSSRLVTAEREREREGGTRPPPLPKKLRLLFLRSFFPTFLFIFPTDTPSKLEPRSVKCNNLTTIGSAAAAHSFDRESVG